MDKSPFSLYREDGRQRVWRRVGERWFADVNVVDRVAHCCAIHPRPSPHVAA